MKIISLRKENNNDFISMPSELQERLIKEYENYLINDDKHEYQDLLNVVKDITNWIFCLNIENKEEYIVYIDLPINISVCIACRLKEFGIKSYCKLNPLIPYMFI